MEVYIDEDGLLSPDAVLDPAISKRFGPIRGEGVSLWEKGTYWLRFQFQNSSEHSIPLYLVNPSTYTDYLDLYKEVSGHLEWQQTRGDHTPWDQDNSYRLPLFPIHLEPGLHSYFIRIRTDGPASLKFNLWTPAAFQAHVLNRENLFLGLLFGILLVMIMYNSFLAIRLRLPYYFLYVAYMICFAMVQLQFTGVARQILPFHPVTTFLLNQGVIIGGELVAVFAALFAVRFLDLKGRTPRLMKAINFFYVCSALNILVCLTVFRLSYLTLLFTNTLISCLLVYAGATRCLQRYRPAYFYTTAWVFIILGSLLSMFYFYGFIPENGLVVWSQFVGGAIEVTLLSLALGDRISLEQEKSHQEISHLNGDLNTANIRLQSHIENVESVVEEKTRDIRSIMEHIPLGIFMIETDQSIHRDHSQHLKELFQTRKLEHLAVSHLLFDHCLLGADEKSQALSCLQASLGEDLINFEMNIDALPLALTRQTLAGRLEHFDLTWNAMEGPDGRVARILVTVRDVTDLKKLQTQNSAQQDELELIAEILKVPIVPFIRFMQSSRQLMNDNRLLIHSQAMQRKNPEALKMLFINTHTIKGAARSLYFKKLATSLHESEQYLAGLRDQPLETWDILTMDVQLQKTYRILDSYEAIASDKLGRRVDQMKFVDFRLEQITELYARLKADMDRSEPKKPAAAVLADIRQLFHQKIFREAQEVLQELLDCLPLLAKDLQKEIPKVRIETRGILLNERAEELFRNAFVHLLRNSMDHGIERPTVRRRIGKDPAGTITVEMRHVEDRMIMTLGDDGQGLPIHRIHEIGLARGLIAAGDRVDREQIGHLIFNASLSTTNRLTEISGRGIGMNAVKSFIEAAGGHIRIEWLDQTPTSPDYAAFLLVIDLPFATLFETETLPSALAC